MEIPEKSVRRCTTKGNSFVGGRALMMRDPLQRFLFILALGAWCVSQAYAQDARNVTEPRIPQSCTTLTASLRSVAGKLVEADEAKLDTQRIQAALDSCAAGKAVELKATPERDSFLSGPLQLRAGVTLVVDGGVTAR